MKPAVFFLLSDRHAASMQHRPVQTTGQIIRPCQTYLIIQVGRIFNGNNTTRRSLFVIFGSAVKVCFLVTCARVSILLYAVLRMLRELKGITGDGWVNRYHNKERAP